MSDESGTGELPEVPLAAHVAPWDCYRVPGHRGWNSSFSKLSVHQVLEGLSESRLLGPPPEVPILSAENGTWQFAL